jgi:hypothetical protein
MVTAIQVYIELMAHVSDAVALDARENTVSPRWASVSKRNPHLRPPQP